MKVAREKYSSMCGYHLSAFPKFLVMYSDAQSDFEFWLRNVGQT